MPEFISSERKNSLNKTGIIRGHDSFKKVLENSEVIRTNLLKGFVHINNIPIIKNPLLNNELKVGFIVSKRKFRLAVLRNRARRIMREAYRNFIPYEIKHLKRKKEVSMIIGLNEKINGNKLKELKPADLKNDIKELFLKLSVKINIEKN